MDRREFIKAALAIPAIAALPAPAKAAEELLDGVIYISQTWIEPYGEGKRMAFTESWHKSAGKVWRSMVSEEKLVSLEEMSYCPWIAVPWSYSPASKGSD